MLALIDDMYVPRINKKNISQAACMGFVCSCLKVLGTYSYTIFLELLFWKD